MSEKRQIITIVLFVVICAISAVTLVYSKQESRKLYTELEKLRNERDELNVEWRQLLTEESTWATPALIERLASERLQLIHPSQKDIRIIQEQ